MNTSGKSISIGNQLKRRKIVSQPETNDELLLDDYRIVADEVTAACETFSAAFNRLVNLTPQIVTDETVPEKLIRLFRSELNGEVVTGVFQDDHGGDGKSSVA